MIALLCGARPGELSKLKWADVLPRERCFIIRGAKAKNDIRVPMSAAIAREFENVGAARRSMEILTSFRRVPAGISQSLMWTVYPRTACP